MITITTHKLWLRNELKCMISQQYPQLHHVMSGSMTEVIGLVGGSSKSSDWLQIPLKLHYHTGDQGIHTIGVLTWEAKYGTQVSFLDEICELAGYNVWELAGIERCY